MELSSPTYNKPLPQISEESSMDVDAPTYSNALPTTSADDTTSATSAQVRLSRNARKKIVYKLAAVEEPEAKKGLKTKEEEEAGTRINNFIPGLSFEEVKATIMMIDQRVNAFWCRVIIGIIIFFICYYVIHGLYLHYTQGIR